MLRIILTYLVAATLLANCGGGPRTPSPTLTPSRADLVVEILYPSEQREFQTGEALRVTLRVTDAAGTAADEAAVRLTLQDESGASQATLDLVAAGEQGVFRSPAWIIPMRAAGGRWSLEMQAILGAAKGAATRHIVVTPSTTRMLHDKYGFWLDPPAVMGIAPELAAERGNGRNGMIRWGGALPAAHILPAAWIDVQWRQGDFGLTDGEAVRRFLLDQVGDLGASRVRSLEEPRLVRFKTWEAWLVPARGQLRYEQVEWLVFHAPEVDRTFALGTTLVMPGSTFPGAETLRRSFDVDAAWAADGVAPEALPDLLPGPVLTEPGLGEEFTGSGAEILLRWDPVKALDEDESYEVTIDYAYDEGTPLLRLDTRQTWLRLPMQLYHEPNCGVFNWTVTLIRAGPGPSGTPLSYPSLYAYLVWKRPPSDPSPFPPLCPNEQR